MENKLTCSQILALMSFYIDNNLSAKLRSYVDAHLKECKSCREAYLAASSNSQFLTFYENLPEGNYYSNKQYEIFLENLSAYIDNELDANESVRIKKFAISNPVARQKLEGMYTFRKFLQNSFEKTKNELRQDYSKKVINMLSSSENTYSCNPFIKLAGAFTIMIFAILIGFLTLLSYS